MHVASAFASSMDQMAVMIEGVTEEMRKHWKKARGGGGAGGEHRSFLDPLLGFVHAMDWTEPWLVGLIVFHITLLVLAVASRKHSNVQMAMFFCVLLCVYVAERMNIYLHRHWKSFARQPYFDSHEDDEEEAAGPYFGGIQVRIQRFGIRVRGSEKTRTLLRLFSCLDLDASFFAEEEAEAGPFFGGIEVRIQRFGFRV
ncbi:unnamed protein product [Sphagnum balticum]